MDINLNLVNLVALLDGAAKALGASSPTLEKKGIDHRRQAQYFQSKTGAVLNTISTGDGLLSELGFLDMAMNLKNLFSDSGDPGDPDSDPMIYSLAEVVIGAGQKMGLTKGLSLLRTILPRLINAKNDPQASSNIGADLGAYILRYMENTLTLATNQDNGAGGNNAPNPHSFIK